MTALYIILGIIFLIWLLLFQFVTVDFSFLDSKLKVKVKYLFFTVFDLDKFKEESEKDIENESPSKKEKQKKSNQKEIAKKETASESKEAVSSDNSKENNHKFSEKENDKKSQKRKKPKKSLEDILFDIGDKIEFIKKLYDIGKRPVFKILKGIHLTKVFIDFDVANEDAYDAAINFGRMNALVFNALASLSCLFTVKKKSIDIHCIYNSSKSKYDVSFFLKLRPTTVISAAFSFGVKYLIYFILKPKFENFKSKKKSTAANAA